MLSRLRARQAERFQRVLREVEARQVRLADEVAHAEVHEPQRVLPVARPRDDLEMREVPPHELGGAHRRVDVVDREHEHFGARRAGSLQHLQARRVAVVHLVAEAAHEVDLRDARLRAR